MRYEKKFGLILSVVLICFIYQNATVSAKDINLQKNKTVHYEEIDDLDSFYIPPCKYCNITIENIKLQGTGTNTTTKYNSYIKVLCFDSHEEYFCDGDKISFKMNGKYDKKDRMFTLELDEKCPLLFDDDSDDYYDYILCQDDDYCITCDITCNITGSLPSKLTKTKITCYLDDRDGKTISIKNPEGTVRWSLSNTKIAKIYRDDNLITIYPKKPGSCYLRAQCGGKTLKCKVRIKGRKKLYAGGILTSYSTRNNIFTMKFKNCSNKKVTILPSNIIAVDSDYKEFDRMLKIGKSITILPGQEKKINFHVIGNYTWHDVDDFCINYSIKYKNKIYRIASDTETTWIRRNGRWKTLLTYDEIGYY